jgi:hypothetical protein
VKFEVEDITQLEKNKGGTVFNGGNTGTGIKAVTIFDKFITFLAGAEVKLGLVVYDFLITYGVLRAEAGAEIQGGLRTDDFTVTGYIYSGDENTVGTYRWRLDTGSPLPKFVLEQLTSLGPPYVWTWAGEFGPSEP